MELFSSTKINSRKKIVITILALVILSLCSYFFILRPFFKKFHNYQNELSAKKIEAENKFKKNVTIENLLKDIKGTEQQIQKLNSMYIKPNRELELITNLEEVAVKNKVKQTLNINRDGDKNSGKLKKYILQIKITGEFKNVISYLSDLESKDYYINIFSLDISQASADFLADSILNFSADVYVDNIN